MFGQRHITPFQDSFREAYEDMSNTANAAAAARRARRSVSPPWPPIAPWGLDEARKQSRNDLGTTAMHGTPATFSSTVKFAVDPPGHLSDNDLRQFLFRPSPQRRGGNPRCETEYDALHFDVSPIPNLAPQGYDEIHLRNVFNHDILFAVQKQNRAEVQLERHGLCD